MDKILLPKYQIFSKLEDKIDMFYKQSERITNEEKFDAVIVDEGQDFREEWLLCLEAALKEKGISIYLLIHTRIYFPMIY